jgi:hypothetical protein
LPNAARWTFRPGAILQIAAPIRRQAANPDSYLLDHGREALIGRPQPGSRS